MSGRPTLGTVTTVDPNFKNMSADQVLDLDRAFDEAFGPLNDLAPKPVVPPKTPEETPKEEKPEGTGEGTPTGEPPKPEERPGEQPAKEEPKAEPKPTLPPEPKEGEPHPDDESDEELDKLQLHPDSRPETITVFRQIRGALKQERKIAKELRDRLGRQDQELVGLRSNRPVSDPQVQQELEYLRGFHTKHQVFDDTGYQTQFEAPVQNIFDDIIRDVKSIAPDQQAAADWEAQIRGLGPDRVDRGYWNDGVLSQCQDPLHKDRLTRKISFLLEAQDKRNQFRDHMAAEPAAFEQFRNQQAADYWQNFSVEAEDEAKKLIPTLGEWASPKDVALAKTTAERAAWESHNKTYQEHEQNFKNYLTDAATNGPRGMTRVAVAAVMGIKFKRDLDAANARITKLTTDLKEAQDELAKITGARNTVTRSSGTSTRTEVPRTKLGKSTEDAFKEFFPQ